MNDTNYLISNGINVTKSLELFGDLKTYNDTVGEFLISAKEKVSKLELYKEKKDMANYATYAHSLTNDARYFGFTQLETIASTQETKSRGGDVYYVYDHNAELVEEVKRLCDVINNYLNPQSNTSSTSPSNNQTVISPAAVTAAVVPAGEVYDKKTILVVDDSNVVRNFVKRIFSEKYGVGTAKDGQIALDIIKANQTNDTIQAILLDLNMPNVDGFAVLNYMQENNLFSKMPVSIISGDSSKETINKAFKYQIVDMLGKPFNEADIKRIIEKTMYIKEQEN